LSLNIAQLVLAQNMTQQQREALIDYCFQNAGRPNPIDDLIDKGFLSPSLRGETCLSVRETYEKEQMSNKQKLSVEQEVANLANQIRIDDYHKCLQNKTNEECLDILDNKDDSDSYFECIQNRSTTREQCQNFLTGNMSENIIK